MNNLLIEEIDFGSVENKILTESSKDGKPVKKYYLSGVHAEAEVKNGNGRIYPLPVLEKNIIRLNEKDIPYRRMLGELSHPNNLDINYERVSHLTIDLKLEGNQAIGKSLVMDTPLGRIVKNLMDEDVKIGTSTRGAGTLKQSIVQNDYFWKCNDLVHDPSAPNATLSAICENRLEWVLEEGVLTEKEVQDVVSEVNKVIIEHQFSIEDRQSAFLKIFQNTLNKIKTKHI